MLNILIADDEKELLELYNDLLQNDARSITTCMSGAKAIELLQDNHFDLVISDKKMGKVSGLDILAHVEKHHPSSVFFLITGDNSSEIQFKHAKSKLIRKPFSFSDLNSSIDNIKS